MSKEKEIKVVDEKGGHDIKLFQRTYIRYIALSRYLFAGGENAIYDINEIPKDNEFYKDARAIAKSLKINWKSMTHEESNRIMLALLEDTYNAMTAVGDKKDLIVELTLKIRK